MTRPGRGKVIALVAGAGVVAVLLLALPSWERLALRLGWHSRPKDIVFTGPPIEAVVQAVDSTQGLVVLSVGRDQRVQEGFQFFVYRGDTLVGKVKVIKVYDDLAGARIVTTERNQTFKVGDKAATQL